MFSKQFRRDATRPNVRATVIPAAMLMWARVLRRSGTGVLHVGVDVGAGGAEVDVIYISFIVSVQYIGY